MNILFVKSSIGSSLMTCFDMGIASMSAVLKQHHHKVSYFSFDHVDASPALFRRIKSFKPDIVGFSATTSTFPSSIKISKHIKANYPQIIIIFGGVHPTISPDCIYASKSIDAICQGEGEHALLEFIQNLEKHDNSYISTQSFWVRNKKNKIIKNPMNLKINDINLLPNPDRSIFLNEGILKYPREYYPDRFGMEFIFSRGCPFECAYCSNHALNKMYGGRFVRQKNPHLAIKEIKYVIKHYRCDYFKFHDDTFTINPKWLDVFLTEYSKIKIPFQCNIRADVCTKEILQKMKNAGCEEVLIGVESGNDDIRMNVLNKRIDTATFFKAFLWAKEVGLKTSAYVLIGLPEETPEKFIDTIRFIGKVGCDNIFLYVFYPYIGTKLYTYCLSKGYLTANSFYLRTIREREDTILTMPQFSRTDIMFYYNNFFNFLDLSKRENDSIYNKVIFHLSTTPPSSRKYVLYKLILKLTRVLNIRSHVHKIINMFVKYSH